ncbi:MAG: hypothetical protein WCK89_09200, partial [bacterium]
MTRSFAVAASLCAVASMPDNVFAQDPDPNLISVDFIYDDYDGTSWGLSAPCEGDTTVAAGDVQNADGLMFTGQAGPWNAVNTGGNNYGNNSVGPSGFLKNGAGVITTVKFSMGTPAGGGDFHNNYIFDFAVGGVKKLRDEQTYLYPDANTGTFFFWQFSGLEPFGQYNLVAFGAGAADAHTANSVAGSQDTEGDWNWSAIQPDAEGKITGYYNLNAGGAPGIYGFQLLTLATPLELAAHAGADKALSPGAPSAELGASLAATGGTGPYTYKWSPATGLSDDTAAHPTVTTTNATTTYTLTVKDSLAAEATDAVDVTYTVPPLVANAGADKTVAPGSPVVIGGDPAASGGSTVYTYSWSPATGLSDYTAANPTASPNETTTYTLTVTDSFDTTPDTDSVLVTYVVPNERLISVDFVYDDGGLSAPCEGDTTVAAGDVQNADG